MAQGSSALQLPMQRQNASQGAIAQGAMGATSGLQLPNASRARPVYLGSEAMLFHPELWPSMVLPPAQDAGHSLTTLEQSLLRASHTPNAALNHHSEVLVELASLVIAGGGDSLSPSLQEALVLVSDRLQLLHKLGRGQALHLAAKFYDELRESHKPPRIRNAELSAHLLTPSQKQSAHALKTLGFNANEPTTGGDPDTSGRGGDIVGAHHGGWSGVLAAGVPSKMPAAPAAAPATISASPTMVGTNNVSATTTSVWVTPSRWLISVEAQRLECMCTLFL